MQSQKEYDERWLEMMFQKTEFETKGHSKTAFVMYIDSSKIKSHGKLKMLELRHKIVTQHVTLELALQAFAKKQRHTLQNIIAKANVKLGGRNYSVNPVNGSNFLEPSRWISFTENTLVIAADVCRPDTLRATVGLCSNAMNADPSTLSGYFAWQTERQEHIDDDVIREFVARSFHEYRRTRGRDPLHVLYLHDGVNESQHHFVYNEIDAIRSIHHVPITALLVLKRHNVRFLTEDIKNPLPGTVVDTVVVNPVIPEFYLQPHRPLMGTVKAPMYRQLLNEGGYEKKELIEICHLMAYNQQICQSPVSLPAPVYGAHELAKRGNYILKQMDGGEQNIEGSTRLMQYEVSA